MSVTEVIDQLGGTAKTAELFEVVPSAVSNWRKAGRFPSRLHYRIARELRTRRIKFDEKLFDDAA